MQENKNTDSKLFWFILHVHPKGLPVKSLKYTHTFGLGGMLLVLFLIRIFSGMLLKFRYVPVPAYAWDTEKNKWFHLYPDDTIVYNEWLHWTNQGQNWNGMCASCHSTNLVKSLDPETGIYKTTWNEKRRIPHYGEIIFAGRNMLPGTDKDLAKLAGDKLFPVIVRATALSLLGQYHGEESRSAFIKALSDEEGWIRLTAVCYFSNINPEDIKEYILPMLYDPVKAVRMDADMTITELQADQLNEKQKNMLIKYKFYFRQIHMAGN